MEFDVQKIRADFPVLSRRVYGKPLVYFDNGATAQKPYAVIDKVDYLHREMNANVHRGLHFMSETCTDEYEAARRDIAAFIGAGSTREIVFTAGATAAINTVAYSFGERYIGPGDNVVTTEMEHHANIVPWQLIRGVPVLVDGCQGIVHGGVDVAALDCDFYAFSGHKLYGPTGIGVLYGKERLLDEMPPFMGGGDMVGTVSFSGTTYAELPLKFEAGTTNYIGAIGLAEAVRYLNGIDLQAAHRHETALKDYATQRLSAIPGVRIYGTQPGKCSIMSFGAEGVHPYDAGMILDKLGVAVRTGTHCAEPVMTHYGITSMIRASLAMYNTIEEVDVFADGLIRALDMLRA